jgi:methyl-accepting chemotaxis protein
MWVNRMKIGARLNLGFSVVMGLAVALCAAGLWALSSLKGGLDQVAGFEHKKTVLLADLELATLERAIAARNLVLQPVGAPIDVQMGVIETAKKEIDESLEGLSALLNQNAQASAADRESLAKAVALEARYWPIAQAIVKASNEGRKEEATASLIKDCIPLLAELKQGLHAFALLNQRENDATLEAVMHELSAGRLWLWGMGLAAFLLGSALAMLIQRSVVKPLSLANQALSRVAKGDLTQAMPVEGRDEVTQMSASLNAMQSSLKAMIGSIRNGVDSIDNASSEIARGNHDLSLRTEQTASNLEEAAASMEQLTSTVRSSSDASRQANRLAANASEVAVRGGEMVGQVVATMEAIQHSSQKINDIIGVIDGIAFQTNILALNAAVEAARAGEQGRGFAVVASEVRHLAQRSAEAAKEIKGLIGTSVDRVEAGSRLVGEAGQTMNEIVGSVQRVSQIIAEITAAAGEQSDGLAQVNTAVMQLDQMTQQNAALVEQSAAAAQSLKDQASQLAGAVQVFRLH